MKNRHINKFRISGLGLVLTIMFTACTELDIENPNDPSAESINESTLSDLAAGALYNVINGYSPSPETGNLFNANVHLAWTADHISMTNNFRSMWSQFQTEPRVQFNNSLTFADLELIGDPWRNWNAAISAANTVIRELKDADTDENRGVLATAYLSRGLALGHIAGVFNQGYIVTEDDDIGSTDPAGVLQPYANVLNAAIASLDAAIAIYDDGISYTMGTTFLNGIGYDQAQLSSLAKTYAAHFLATTPRTASENAQVDWATVRDYALGGIQTDFSINADGQFILHDLQYVSGLFWYFRVDHRILQHFNPTYPSRFPTEADASIGEDVLTGDGYNGDQRLAAYYTYSSDLSFFRLERGAQLRTHYYYSRYDALWNNNGVGASIYMPQLANDLLLAEAYARLGNTSDALAILNDPTYPRIAVGEMPDIESTISQEDLIEAIFAERDIELPRTAFGLEFFDMRRKDALQEGTVLHLPVPADELTTIGLDIYSYGGPGNADGINTATGANSWLGN